jgi:hypothetical protein
VHCSAKLRKIQCFALFLRIFAKSFEIAQKRAKQRKIFAQILRVLCKKEQNFALFCAK